MVGIHRVLVLGVQVLSTCGEMDISVHRDKLYVSLLESEPSRTTAEYLYYLGWNSVGNECTDWYLELSGVQQRKKVAEVCEVDQQVDEGPIQKDDGFTHPHKRI